MTAQPRPPWDPDPRFVVEPQPVDVDDQRGLVAGCAFVLTVALMAFLAGVALSDAIASAIAGIAS